MPCYANNQMIQNSILVVLTSGYLAIDFFANQLGVTVSSDHISRSHRSGKRGRTPRPIIVRLVHHNMKVQLLRKRRELKAQETNFDIREDLTQCLRNILHYLHNDITEGIIDKVWTIDGIIFMRPTSRSSVIEKCTTLSKCHKIVNKYSQSATEASSALSRRSQCTLVDILRYQDYDCFALCIIAALLLTFIYQLILFTCLCICCLLIYTYLLILTQH